MKTTFDTSPYTMSLTYTHTFFINHFIPFFALTKIFLSPQSSVLANTFSSPISNIMDDLVSQAHVETIVLPIFVKIPSSEIMACYYSALSLTIVVIDLLVVIINL